MKFQLKLVIIQVFIYFTNCLIINEIYIEDYCRQEFVTLSIDVLIPSKLYLSRRLQDFGPTYCSLKLNTSDNFPIIIRGHLGQLVLDQTRSDDKLFHFVFNTNITENKLINETVLANELNIIVENNEIIASNNQLNDNLMQTDMDLIEPIFFKMHDFITDCEESNDPKCLNTEEELDESSGEVYQNYDTLCSSNDCSTESDKEIDDNENNLPTKHINSVIPLKEFDLSSGSNSLCLNKLQLITILQFLAFYLRFIPSF